MEERSSEPGAWQGLALRGNLGLSLDGPLKTQERNEIGGLVMQEGRSQRLTAWSPGFGQMRRCTLSEQLVPNV